MAGDFVDSHRTELRFEALDTAFLTPCARAWTCLLHVFPQMTCSAFQRRACFARTMGTRFSIRHPPDHTKACHRPANALAQECAAQRCLHKVVTIPAGPGSNSRAQQATVVLKAQENTKHVNFCLDVCSSKVCGEDVVSVTGASKTLFAVCSATRRPGA